MSTKTAVVRESFALVLDSAVPLNDQIQRGNYAFVNEYYTAENFPLTLTGKREVILFDPKGYVSSETMIARMKADGFVPATIDDCLAFGTTFLERQRKNPIVFLGTVFRDPRGRQHLPVLGGWGGKRELRLSWFDDGWDGNYRFAAVRES